MSWWALPEGMSVVLVSWDIVGAMCWLYYSAGSKGVVRLGVVVKLACVILLRLPWGSLSYSRHAV